MHNNRLNLYWPEPYHERLREVAARLETQGERVRDNRGNISLSKALQILVDREQQRAAPKRQP